MKTRIVYLFIALLVAGSQVSLFAQQQADRTKKKPRFTPEQMMEMQTNRIVKALALDDATTAKFTPVYTQYLKDLRECRAEAWKQMKQDKAEAGKQPGAKKEMLTDAEVEQRIKDRFAHSRKMLDIREKYYKEFKKILTPRQLQKIYDKKPMAAGPHHKNNRIGRKHAPASHNKAAVPCQECPLQKK